MKIIFAVGSKGDPSYYAPTINALLENQHDIIILNEQSKLEQRATLFESYWGTTIAYQKLRIRAKLPAVFIDLLRNLRTLSNYLRRSDQSPMYAERAYMNLHENGFMYRFLPFPKSPLLKTIIFNLVKYTFVENLLCSIENRLIPPARSVKQHLQELRPDVVIATPANLFALAELEYLKAAKALHIPTLISVHSWDNLTTKSLIHVEPDLLIAWNQAHYTEAQQVHHLSSNHIIITGSQLFDKWFADTDARAVSREAHCETVGLSPDRPYLLYLGSSRAISDNETWLVQALLETIGSHPDLKHIQLLVRPHPDNIVHYEKMPNRDGLAIYPRERWSVGDTSKIEDLYNAIHHAFAVIGVNTSGMIDAIVLNKPVIALMTDAYATSQRETQHFQHLLQADVLEIADGVVHCPTLILQLLKGNDQRQQQRQTFIQTFVRPRGQNTHVGTLNATVVEQVSQGKTLPDIERQLPPLVVYQNHEEQP